MSEGPPLQRLFTLPFALHLQPLPELSYVPRPRRGDDDSLSESSAASDDNAVGAGANKLEPRVRPFPPHPLETISFLLQHTDILSSVPRFAELLSLLDAADPDPGFATLRAFFDARYDEAGLLVGSEESQAHAARQSSLRRKASSKRQTEKRKTSFVAPGASASSPPKPRTLSTSTSASAGGGFKLLPRLRRMTSSSRGDVDSQDASASEGGLLSPGTSGGGTSSTLRAPELLILPRANSTGDAPRKEKRVRFGIRLDLHSVNLAPPPRSPAYGRVFERRANKRADSTLVVGSPEGQDDRGRLRSPSLASQDLSLQPVNSTSSVFSQSTGASEAGPEDRAQSPGRWKGREAYGQPSSPTRGGSKANRRGLLGVGSRTSSTKSGATRSYTLDTETLATSPEMYESFGSKMRRGSATSLGGRKRSIASESKRSGIISRFLDFGGGKGSSALCIDEAGDDSDGGRGATESAVGGGLLVPPEAGRAAGRRGSTSNHSDLSNEDALDTADDESSLPSSLGWSAGAGRFGPGGRRRSSASGAAAGASGFSLGVAQESELRPLKEGHVLAPESVSSRVAEAEPALSDTDGAMSDPSSGRSPTMDGAAFQRAWVEGTADFLTLLRQASERSLRLKSDIVPEPPKSEKAKGKQRDDASSQELTPGGSLDLEREKLAAMGLGDPKQSAPPTQDQLSQEILPDPWWPSGRADPLPMSFAAALAPAFGWEGILNLCYGAPASSAAKEQFVALGKAAELEERIRSDSMRVKRWALDVSRSAPGSPRAGSSDVGEEGQAPPGPGLTTQATETIVNPETVMESLDARLASVIDAPEPASTAVRSSELAPSDAVSAQLLAAQERKAPVGGSALLSRLVRRLQGKVDEEDDEGNNQGTDADVDQALSTTGRTGAGQGADARRLRGWADWAALAASMAGWVEQYESTRVRHGLAKELGKPGTSDVAPAAGADGIPMSPNVGQDPGPSAFQIAGPPVPEGILQDLAANNSSSDVGAFRRRDGIPEGLATGVDGEEFEDYRWSRANLEPQHFGTAMLLTATSISHFLEQLSTASWPSRSAWELDYLEMLVFRSPLVAERFPPPSSAVVPARQCFNPTSTPGGASQASRAYLCPTPASDGSWDATAWRSWLSGVKEGQILVPAVSWQAWWTLISILNGADGSGRSLDLQVKSPQEPFEALTDLRSIYI